MYSLETFTKADLYQCSVALRNFEYRSQTMEDTANRIVRYLYNNFRDPHTDQQELALVRFFKTHPFRDLNRRLQREAQAVVPGQYISPATTCLMLVATIGDEPHWNVRQESRRHQAIPLIDQDFVQKAPMISQLIQQFGLKISTVVATNPALITENPHRTFNVFYIQNALNSPYIPAQKEFVAPYRLKSVVGFGGMLPSNELFAVILFSKKMVKFEIANNFRLLSAYVRVAIESFQGRDILLSEILRR